MHVQMIRAVISFNLSIFSSCFEFHILSLPMKVRETTIAKIMYVYPLSIHS
jgi:hypothetical protein